MPPFWRTCMIIACWGTGIFGAILAAGGLAATSGPVHGLLELLGGAPFEITREMHFAIATLGAVTMGWAVTIYATVEAATALGDRGGRIWGLLVAAALTWFIVDSTLSVATGFALNLIPNIVVLASFLIPIFASGVLKRGG